MEESFSHKKELSVEKRRREFQKNIFLTAIIGIPLLNFVIFYIFVNFNSIIMAFQEYNLDTSKFEWAGIKNFKNFFDDVFHDKIMITAMKNSAILFCSTLTVSLLCILITYFLWSGILGSGFFRVVLFLPQMISSMVFVCIGRYFIGNALPVIFNNPSLSNALYQQETQFITTLIYDMFFGLAGNMILYLGAMSGVSKDVVEYGKIDGVNTAQELWHIVLPAIYPTISTFLVVHVATYFSSYGSMFSFQGQYAYEESYTLGYYFFNMIYSATTYAEYPYAATGGLAFTLLAIPLTYAVRWLLAKVGPKEE